MRAIETQINVREVGEAILTLPKDLSPGKYKVVLVVYEEKEDDLSLSPEIDDLRLTKKIHNQNIPWKK